MLGAGTVINPIIKLVTTVAILAAVYFFIVKPTLDTTNNAFDSFSEPFNNLPSSIQGTVDDAFNSLNDAQSRDRLERCIKQAQTNTQRINRCIDQFAN